jgi:riboflavin synthase
MCSGVTAVDDGGWFEVGLIPHTLAVTVLGSRGVGDRVNLEVDVIARYVERAGADAALTLLPGLEGAA